MGADGILVIDGLDKPLTDYSGEPLPSRKGPDGKDLPKEEQIILGYVLSALVSMQEPAKKASESVTRTIVVIRLREATDAGLPYSAGSAALGALRAAAKANTRFGDLIMSQVWQVIGTGDAGEDALIEKLTKEIAPAEAG